MPDGAKVEYLVKSLNEADTDVLRQVVEADIYKIASTPNLADKNFVGNSSGVAIRYKLISFIQSIKGKERYFEKALLERFELYNTFLANKGKMEKIEWNKIDVVFKSNLPENELELSNMINNLTGIVDKKTLISQLPFVSNADEVLERLEDERVDDSTGFSEPMREIMDTKNMLDEDLKTKILEAVK